MSPKENRINKEIIKNIFKEYSLNVQGVMLMNQENFVNSIIKMYEVLNDSLPENNKMLLKDWYNKLGFYDNS